MIFRPIDQVGWASASSTVTCASSSRARPRNGPPEAVSTRSGPRPHHDHRGTGRALNARCRRARALHHPAPAPHSASSPAATRLSLFASARVTPRSSAQSVARTPAKPTIRVQDDVRLARLEQRARVAADLRRARRMCRCDVVERRRSGQEGADFELGACGDDLERLTADRACGAEKRDPLHAREKVAAQPPLANASSQPCLVSAISSGPLDPASCSAMTVATASDVFSGTP